MKALAPNLFQRRFQDFVEMGRARLPSLAPEWTDHNAHDPGITLMELLAWVAEAQLYSLSRMLRDERTRMRHCWVLLRTERRAQWTYRPDASIRCKLPRLQRRCIGTEGTVSRSW